MHPAGIFACITPLRADRVDGVNDLRIARNGQESSLNGKAAIREQVVGNTRYSRAEYHRQDSWRTRASVFM